MPTAAELKQQIEQLSTDIGDAHSFVHGAKDETVLLGDPAIGGAQPTPTPTLRGLVESVKVATNAAIADTAAEMQQQIRQEGSTQITRVQEEATYQIGLASAQADRASSEADRAKAEADRAVDMTGVGAASKTNFGFVKIGDGIEVESDGTISVSRGMLDYTIPVTDASGSVPVQFSALGHPVQSSLVNPRINLLSSSPYFYGITRRNLEGFTVQIYRPDGTPGADIVEFVELGTFECGDGTECGQSGGGADVTLLVSLPQ